MIFKFQDVSCLTAVICQQLCYDIPLQKFNVSTKYINELIIERYFVPCKVQIQIMSIIPNFKFLW